MGAMVAKVPKEQEKTFASEEESSILLRRSSSSETCVMPDTTSTASTTESTTNQCFSSVSNEGCDDQLYRQRKPIHLQIVNHDQIKNGNTNTSTSSKTNQPNSDGTSSTPSTVNVVAKSGDPPQSAEIDLGVQSDSLLSCVNAADSQLEKANASNNASSTCLLSVSNSGISPQLDHTKTILPLSANATDTISQLEHESSANNTNDKCISLLSATDAQQPAHSKIVEELESKTSIIDKEAPIAEKIIVHDESVVNNVQISGKNRIDDKVKSVESKDETISATDDEKKDSPSPKKQSTSKYTDESTETKNTSFVSLPSLTTERIDMVGKNKNDSSKSTNEVIETEAMTGTSNESPSKKDNVASALDEVLAELEHGSKSKTRKKRPCILQQSLITDEGSSGTSTPSSDDLSDGKKPAVESKNAPPLRVESSMLVPEDSLRLIAQMTVDATGSKQRKKEEMKQRRPSVRFGSNSLIDNYVDSSILQPDGKDGDSGKQNTKLNPMTQIEVKGNTSVSTAPLEMASEQIKNLGVVKTSNISLDKGNNIAGENTAIVSGTAAAHLQGILKKGKDFNGTMSIQDEPSQTLDVPTIKNNSKNEPSLNMSVPLKSIAQSENLDGDVVARDGSVGIELNVQEHQPAILETSPVKYQKSDPPPDPISDAKVDSDKSTSCSLGTELTNGMDMLADITSHAVPMSTLSSNLGSNTKIKKISRAQASHREIGFGMEPKYNALNKIPKTEGSQIVPVGQSLSIYNSIVAQAGIPIYSSTETITHSQQHTLSTQGPPVISEYSRELGKIRRYNAEKGGFSEWANLSFQSHSAMPPKRWCDLNLNDSIEIPLRRGGRLRVFPNFVSENRRCLITDAMKKCKLYRQYYRGPKNSLPEARSHVLLSSDVAENKQFRQIKESPAPGYVYSDVTMKAEALSLVPEVQSLANDLATLYNLPDDKWNIGAELAIYKDGNDHYDWHADDTQNEALVLSIMTESSQSSRPILIRPKRNDGVFQEGDEEIFIFAGQGDAYEMDGRMQASYEHCLPRKDGDFDAKKSMVVFRHGSATSVLFDTGTAIEKLATIPNDVMNQTDNISPPKQVKKQPAIYFGHPSSGVVEGKRGYTKKYLIDTRAHVQDKKNVNGNLRDGCDSLLVESQDPLLRESDGLCWLQYTGSRADGGGALCRSYHTTSPVRVFRSSELECRYAPAADKLDEILYRYDGLYSVKAMWDAEGNETEAYPPGSGSQHTFFLTRLPMKPLNRMYEDGMHYNKMGIQELWREIQKRNGVRKLQKFEIPQPPMDLPRVGEKPRVQRNKVMPKVKNVTSKNRTRAKSPPKPIPKRRLTCDEILKQRTKIKAKPHLHNLRNSADRPNRPKRASAAAARSYLKEVMQNRNGCIIGNDHATQSYNKRPLWQRYSSQGIESDNDSDNSERIIGNACTKDILSCDSEADEDGSSEASSSTDCADESDHITDKVSSDDDSDLIEEEIKQREIENERARLNTRKRPRKRNIKKICNDTKSSETSQSSKKSKLDLKEKKQPGVKHGLVENNRTVEKDGGSEEKETRATKDVDPETIVDGSRVFVEYKKFLYKATVRRSRIKGGIQEYQIHYDGNRKSNVHWISLSMIYQVLSEPITEEKPDVRSKKGCKISGRGRKAASSKKKISTSRGGMTGTTQLRKFADSSYVYVEYKAIFYLAMVRKSRQKSKDLIEYLIHYDGYKKTSDGWVEESSLYPKNCYTTRRYNKERREGLTKGKELEFDSREEECERASEVDVGSTAKESEEEVKSQEKIGTEGLECVQSESKIKFEAQAGIEEDTDVGQKEAVVEEQAEVEVGQKLRAEIELGVTQELEADAEVKVEPEVKVEIEEAKIEAVEVKVAIEVETKSKTEIAGELKVEAESETKIAGELKVEAATKAATETETETEAATETETETEAVGEFKLEAETESEANVEATRDIVRQSHSKVKISRGRYRKRSNSPTLAAASRMEAETIPKQGEAEIETNPSTKLDATMPSHLIEKSTRSEHRTRSSNCDTPIEIEATTHLKEVEAEIETNPSTKLDAAIPLHLIERSTRSQHRTRSSNSTCDIPIEIEATTHLNEVEAEIETNPSTKLDAAIPSHLIEKSTRRRHGTRSSNSTCDIPIEIEATTHLKEAEAEMETNPSTKLDAAIPSHSIERSTRSQHRTRSSNSTCDIPIEIEATTLPEEVEDAVIPSHLIEKSTRSQHRTRSSNSTCDIASEIEATTLTKEAEAEMETNPSTKLDVAIPSHLIERSTRSQHRTRSSNSTCDIASEIETTTLPKEAEAEMVTNPSTKLHVAIPSHLIEMSTRSQHRTRSNNSTCDIASEMESETLPKEAEAEMVTNPSTKLHVAIPSHLIERSTRSQHRTRSSNSTCDIPSEVETEVEAKETTKHDDAKTSHSMVRRTRGRCRKRSSASSFDVASTLDMGGISPGASFVPGSSIYVLWKNGLYLAKVLNSRKNDADTSSYVHYSGYDDKFDSWVPWSRMYKITPKTKVIFEQSNAINNELLEEGDEEEMKVVKKAKKLNTVHTMERRTRNRTTKEETYYNVDMGDLNSGVAFLPGSGVYATWKNSLLRAKMLNRRKNRNETEYLLQFGESSESDAWLPLSMIYEISPQAKRIFERTKNKIKPDGLSSSASSGNKKDTKSEKSSEKQKPKSTQVNRNIGVPSGVDFQSGSALYVEWKNILYHAKMLKQKTIKGNHTKYFVHYDGFRKSSDAWVSISKVYEINSQTRRIFNAQRK